MQITIDTVRDSKEEIQKVIKILQDVVGGGSSEQAAAPMDMFGAPSNESTAVENEEESEPAIKIERY